MKIKNISGERLNVPWLGGRMVMPGQIVEVSADEAYSFTAATAIWEPADDEAQGAHDDGAKAEAKAVRAEAGLDEPDEPVDDEFTVPAKSAGKDEWYAAALHFGVTVPEAEQATKEQLIGMVSAAMNGEDAGNGDR